MNATVTPQPHHDTHLHRAVEIAMLAGAGLVVAAGIVLLSGSWPDFTLAMRVAIAAVGAVALAAAAVVTATRRPGVRALRQTDLHSDHEGRRMLTAVFTVGAAAMTAFAILQFPTGPEYVETGFKDYVAAPPYWTATIALACALAIAVVGAWLAPGVVSTLAVFGFSLATLMTLMEHLTWDPADGTMGARTSLVMALVLAFGGAFGALLAHRWLRPGILVVALSLFAWFIGGVQAAAESERGDAPMALPQNVADAMALTGIVGKASLAVLLVLGVAMFLARSSWPWPAAAIASLVALALILTTSALGVAMAMLITGVLLIVMAGGMLLIWRRRASAATADAQEEQPVEVDVTA